ncbi:bacterial Ig-like domain (Group 2) [Elysia marginata]|uniref:Bacterial Ig-like domain (Group 2) n=1 Tax=Elysia marginata TaxID=1093978 RepID=A0AAV4JBR2_9GAST|nr:bacterial Ig-like domain (Group 2) [Elysia marginata]
MLLEKITLKDLEGNTLDSTLELDAFKIKGLVIETKPTNTTDKLIWKADKTGYVEIQTSSNGLVAGVKGLKRGEITLEVTAEKNDSIKTSVKANILYKDLKSLRLAKAETLLLSGSDYKEKIEVHFDPEDASNKNIKWVSSDESVAIVDREGFITPKNKGEADVTVTGDGGKQAVVKVKVLTCSDMPAPSNTSNYCSISGSGPYNLDEFKTEGADQDINYKDNDSKDSDHEVYTTESIQVKPGGNFTVSLKHSNTYSKSLIWIDWNGDRDFKDPFEYIGHIGKDNESNTGSFTKNIEVFQCAEVGDKRMRIVTVDAWSNASSCGKIPHSSSKDFKLKVVK